MRNSVPQIQNAGRCGRCRRVRAAHPQGSIPVKSDWFRPSETTRSPPTIAASDQSLRPMSTRPEHLCLLKIPLCQNWRWYHTHRSAIPRQNFDCAQSLRQRPGSRDTRERDRQSPGMQCAYCVIRVLKSDQKTAICCESGRAKRPSLRFRARPAPIPRGSRTGQKNHRIRKYKHRPCPWRGHQCQKSYRERLLVRGWMLRGGKSQLSGYRGVWTLSHPPSAAAFLAFLFALFRLFFFFF